jgi:hypothetical protein
MTSPAVKRTFLLGAWLALLLALSQAQSTNSTDSPTSPPSSSENLLEQQVLQLTQGINASWLLLTGALVFMMQAGFAILGTYFHIFLTTYVFATPFVVFIQLLTKCLRNIYTRILDSPRA